MSKPDANGWMPIETAPKDGAVVILYCPQGDGNPGSTYRVTAGEWWSGQDDEAPWEGWVSWDGGFSEDTMMPTHWQPLPAPPVSDPARPMTDIPADIQRRAQQAYDAYADGAGKDIRECIARAILAERAQRNATIATLLAALDEALDGWQYDQGSLEDIARIRAIASAILSPERAGE